MGFTKLESIAHVGENLLSKLRDGELEMTQDIANSLLTMVDAVREILSNIEADRSEGDINYSDLVELMTYLQSGGNPNYEEEEQVEDQRDRSMEEPQVDGSQMFIEEPADPALSGTLFERLGGQKAVDAAVDIFYDKILADVRIKHFFDGVDTERLRNKQKAFMTFAFGGESKYTGKALQEAHQSLVEKGLAKEHFEVFMERFGETLQELNVSEKLIEETLIIALSTRDEVLGQAQMGIGKPEEPAFPAATTVYSEMDEADNQDGDRRRDDKDLEDTYLTQNDDRRAGGDRRLESIRVDVHLLDRLMNLVGELVLARNQILQFNPNERDATFISSTQHLNQLTAELQEGVMKTRMQPIGNIWNEFPRVVRDLAKSCNKKVRLDMEGKDTELDKTLIEAIKDPLTHIVRNSVDHGIEMPEDRVANGKNPEGRLFLRAYHEGGQVNIEIGDDGGGIDPEIIKAKSSPPSTCVCDWGSNPGQKIRFP